MSIKENKQEPVLVEPEVFHTVERGTHETRQAKPAVAAFAFLVGCCTPLCLLFTVFLNWMYDLATK